MEGSAAGMVTAYDPRQLNRARALDQAASPETARGPTRLEEAIGMAGHAVDRVAELANGARDMLDNRLGPRPPQAVGGNGNKEPSIAGSANELHQQLRRLHGALDHLSAELQRLREL